VYARAVTNQIQAGKIDEWLTLIRDSVVPALKERDGFLGFVALVDREQGKTIGYSTWDSETALAVSESSGNYQAQIAKLGAVLASPPVREAYELTVVAFRDAAAGQAHVSSGHFKTAIAQMPGLLAEPPEIVHADVPADGWSRMAELW
jgi:quinol monooxygenase YgiN